MSSIPQHVQGMGVYGIRHIASGRVYIGSSIDMRKRLGRHLLALSQGKHQNSHLQHAWNKYGPTAFACELIEAVMFEYDLRGTEQRHIDAVPREKRYNINPRADVPPSQRGVSPSVETRERLRQTSTGRVKTDSEREKLRRANLGKQRSTESIENQRRAITGRTLTPEHREKIRQAGIGKHKGRKASPETREKLRLAHLGKSNGPRSEETKEKIRQGHLGKKQSPAHVEANRRARLGKPIPPETRAKMSASVKTAWQRRKAEKT